MDVKMREHATLPAGKNLRYYSIELLNFILPDDKNCRLENDNILRDWVHGRHLAFLNEM